MNKNCINILYLAFNCIIILIAYLVVNILKVKKLRKKLKFFKQTINSLPNPIFCKDLQGRYIECNDKFEEYTGLKRSEIIGKKVFEIGQGHLANSYFIHDMELMKNGGVQVYESKIKFENKEFKDVLFSKSLIKIDDSEVAGIAGIIIDITERKKMEKRISRVSKLKSFMIEINNSIIGINNIDELFNLILEKAIEVIDEAKYGKILILNKDKRFIIAASKGCDANKIKEFSIALEESFLWKVTKGNIKHPIIINDISKLHNIKITELHKKMPIQSCISAPIIINDKLYGILNIESNKNNAFSEADLNIIEYMASEVEISINKYNLYQKNIYLSKYDKLTSIYNRRYFEDILNSKLKENKSFRLAIFDLNRLKFVNDNYGHLAGDEYIKEFVRAFKNVVGVSDVFARYGGDEFIAVFLEESEELIKKIEQILENLKMNPIKFGEKSINCSFSYGISDFPEDSMTYDKLIKIADSRMYRCKKKLRNQYD